MDEKISKAVEKRQLLEDKFVKETKEKLDTKLEQAQEKRDEIMEQTKTKLKEHVSNVTNMSILLFLPHESHW